MSKIKTIIDEVKEHVGALKDTIESERIVRLNSTIEQLRKDCEALDKENKQLRTLLVRVINDLDRENKRNKELLSNLSGI